MRKPPIFSAVLTLFLLIPASITWAQTISSQKGLTTAIFPTQYGNIKIYLPDDIRPGEHITGSVTAIPLGKNAKQLEKSLSELKKIQLHIDDKTLNLETLNIIPDKPAPFDWLVQQDRNLSFSVELLHVSGNKPMQLTYQFNTSQGNSRPQTTGCNIPSHALTGSPFRISGSFDGNASNTKCDLNDQPLKILAESPRQCFIAYPENVTGSQILSVLENNQPKCSQQISSVKMNVSTGKLNLKKGENTFIDVNINGLQNLPATAVLTLNNLSGNIVYMFPANDVVIPLTPEKINSGAFQKRFDINSIQTGSYSVNIDLALPDTPVIYYDVPKTGSENNKADNDTIPCPDKTLAEKQTELEALKSELAGIDNAIEKAKADASDCNKVKSEKRKAAGVANENFKKQEQRKKNWEQSGKEAPANVKDDFNKAKKAKEDADAALKEQQKKCDEADKKVKDLENRKSVLPALINSLSALVDVLKTEVEKCKKEAEEKKKKEEEDKKKAADAAAASAATAAADAEAKKNSIATQRYLLQNIYSLGLISSKEFWETKGLWDWLPEKLSKPIGDLLEDKGNPSPIPIDIIPALAGIYQVVGKMLDPCSPDGARKTVERLRNMINTRTNNKYTDEEALDKTEKMCEVLEKLKALSKSAGGK